MDKNKFRQDIYGMNVMVVGLGKSGRAAIKVLLELGCRLAVQDSAPADKIDPEYLRYLDDNGVRTYFGCVPERSENFDMLILSPGVPPSLDFIAEARRKGAEVIGELELAYRLTDAKFVAITGTNGKTTTTALTGEIFKASGRRTAVVGNIGEPVVTEAAGAEPDKWLVTEVSSFQLETAVFFKPEISAILNLTPDHLNRHGTMEAYGKAKAGIAINQDEDEYLIINSDDGQVMKLALQSRANTVPFTRKGRPQKGAFLDGTLITIRDSDGSDHIICDVSELRVIGDHNVENVMAAAAISFFAGIEPDIIADTVRSFPGVEHRIEFCGRRNGVDYYNDSKGTNVDAAVIALRALKNNIILIAGGDGKSQDFSGLAAQLKESVSALILIGRDASRIEEAALRAGFTDIFNCSNMEECVLKASQIAETGDKVLLSPACASWDMYENYEKRGRHFKECVRKLIEE